MGDKITLTTKLGTRAYEVVSVSKVLETDRSGLAATAENMITLYTCVMNQRDYRWCVKAVELGKLLRFPPTFSTSDPLISLDFCPFLGYCVLAKSSHKSSRRSKYEQKKNILMASACIVLGMALAGPRRTRRRKS